MVFSNYSEKATLPAFKRFNLIFGWNGCGKTTLSRLFGSISGVESSGVEYQLEDDGGVVHKHGDPFPTKIRVFNQDFIRENLSLIESRAKTISLILGKENQSLLKQIEKDRLLLEGDPTNGTQGKLSLFAASEKEVTQAESARANTFTEVARTVGAAIGGNALRDYRRPQAESDFNGMPAKAELTAVELEKQLLSVKQLSLSEIATLSLPKVSLSDKQVQHELSNLAGLISSKSKELQSRTVDSEIVERLTSNPDISEWVEAGLILHQKHSSNKCEYCMQQVPIKRSEELARHFNEADRRLKEEVRESISDLTSLREVVGSLRIPDKARFYTALQVDFQAKASAFEREKTAAVRSIDSCTEELVEKLKKTTESVIAKEKLDLESLTTTIGQINLSIDAHNKITNDFDSVRNEAIKKLKQHYLSTIYDGVRQLDGEIATKSTSRDQLKAEIDTLKASITDNLAKMSSTQKACEEINQRLRTFLGHSELSFVPHNEQRTKDDGTMEEVTSGYDIMRGNDPATLLSEGEKTAVAFAYFVVQLADQEFDVSEGIIVIDDPISSLDSNSLYQAFSFLKNAVKESKQVFILTHNFEFLKLLINWLKGARADAGYYMIKNRYQDGVRSAYIDAMDKELFDYESEYHYLFKLLKQLSLDQDGTLAKAYPVPNIARKVWETFLMFRVPNSKSQYMKMDELKKAGLDAVKLDSIYKFTNDQSHITGSGLNPALVPQATKVINEMFEMMAAGAPDHFRILDDATN